MKDMQHELEAALLARDEAVNANKEKDKRCKSLEAEVMQLQEDLAASERARKAVQAEKDDLLEEMNSGTAYKYVRQQICSIL